MAQKPKSSTVYEDLVAEYGTTLIPLHAMCDKYFGLPPPMASRRALSRDLPIPCFRASNQKSPWLVKASDLAKHIDEVAAEANSDWHKMNSQGTKRFGS